MTGKRMQFVCSEADAIMYKDEGRLKRKKFQAILCCEVLLGEKLPVGDNSCVRSVFRFGDGWLQIQYGLEGKRGEKKKVV